MKLLSKRLVQGIGLLFLGVLLLVLCEVDRFFLAVAETLAPGAGALVLVGLLFVEGLGLWWLYRSFFGRTSKLILKNECTESERNAFMREMHARLKRNSHVLDAKISPSDPQFLQKALDHLDTLAEQEIRTSGKRVFLGTALAQNGRLDALIVFFSLCRMIWRISSIYNQKPTAEEFLSVCTTVSSSTFVAFSIDALDLPQTITQTMNELMPSVGPAVAASSVPMVGSAIHIFTHSMIEGAANCLLAVRAGVITRRAYRYAIYGGKETLRQSCVRETGAIMLDISQETVSSVVKALRKEIQEVSVEKSKKFVQNAGKMGSAAVSKVVSGCGAAVDTVTNAAQATASFASENVSRAASAVKETAGATFSGVGELCSETTNVMGQGVGKISDGVKDFQQRTYESGKRIVGQVSEKGQAAFTKVVRGAGDVASFVQENYAQKAQSVSSQAKRAASAVKETAGSALTGVGDLASETGSVVGRGVDLLAGKVKEQTLGVMEKGKSGVDSCLQGVKKVAGHIKGLGAKLHR